jgi:hypothetical protein
MADVERSWTTIAPLVVLVLLLAASAAVPWFLFEFSSGTRNPDAEPGQPANETGLHKEEIRFYPFRVDGDTNETFNQTAHDETRVMGILWAAGLGAGGLAILVELVAGDRRWSRGVTVGLAAVAAVAVLGAILWTWFMVPPVLADRGVDRFFTNRRVDDGGGFIRTSPGWGLIAAAVSIIAALTTMATKYAGGITDVDEVERISRSGSGAPRKPPGPS